MYWPHRIYRATYPDYESPGVHAYEEFIYNAKGQVLTHRLKNGKYVHYRYDLNDVLVIEKTNPTTNSNHDQALNADPLKNYSYSYYTSADTGYNLRTISTATRSRRETKITTRPNTRMMTIVALRRLRSRLCRAKPSFT